MKKSELRKAIKEAIKEVSNNQPAPSKPAPGREVAEPPTRTDKPPGPRRPLTPPKHAPKTTPKNEQEILNKISSRYKSLR